jgi:ComEC/Rec2-related protein
MKQPLAGVVGLFATGILIGRFVAPPLAVLFIVTLGAGLGALLTVRRPRLNCCLLLVAAGWTNLTWRTAVLSPHDLRVLMDREEALVVVHGTLSETPQRRLRERSGGWMTNTMGVIECHSIQMDEKSWQPAAGRVVLSTPSPVDPAFRMGTEVLISGVLRRPSGPAAPGLFDYAEYLHWRGIQFELRAPTAADWRLAPGAVMAPLPWTDAFEAWARTTLARGLPAEDQELRLLWAMTLGWKTGLTDAVEEPFMRSGTMHIFAISGLHIALIAGITAQVLRLILMPRIAIGMVVLPVVWFYTAATGWQPSAVRATLMTSAVVGGWMLSRPLNILNSLAAAGFAVLVWEPRQLFHAGFQLSFGVVAAIGSLLPVLDRVRARIGAIDPFLPTKLVPWWRRIVSRGWWALSGSVALSLSCWVGSLPLTAWHFHLLTPSSLLANLVVVPLSSLALASNMASLCTGLWAPWLCEVFNHSAWFWMRGMLVISTRVAEVPGGYWHVRQPPLSFVVFWYGLLAAIGLGWWKIRGWRIGWIVLTVLLLLDAGYRWSVEALRPCVVVLPLRGGHSVWVRDPSASVLVDTGDPVSARAVTVPFLRAMGVNRLDRLVLTHGDVRHVGGAPLVAEECHLRQLITSPLRFRSPVYRSVMGDLRGRRDCLVTTFSQDGAFGGWTVRYPAANDTVPRADDGCMVLDGSFSGRRVILLSDLSPEGQERLLRRQPELHADLVIAGLPDRGEPLTDGLLRQLSPRWVVIADAAQPATARASEDLKARLRRGPHTVFFTSEAARLIFAGNEVDGRCATFEETSFDLRTRGGPRDCRHPLPRTKAGSFPDTR